MATTSPSDRRPTVPTRPKVLVFSANNIDQPLAVDREWQAIREALGDRAAIYALPAARANELIEALEEHQPTIVHFMGHGSPEGLAMAYPDGSYRPASGPGLRRLFENRGVRLVVLNACYSAVQAHQLAASVDVVVGTPVALEDNASAIFTRTFYRSLGNGETAEAALRSGQTAVSLQHHNGEFQLTGERTWQLPAHEPVPTPALDPTPERDLRETGKPSPKPPVTRDGLLTLAFGAVAAISFGPPWLDALLDSIFIAVAIWVAILRARPLLHIYHWVARALVLLFAANAAWGLWQIMLGRADIGSATPDEQVDVDLSWAAGPATSCVDAQTHLVYQDHLTTDRIAVAGPDGSATTFSGRHPAAVGSWIITAAADNRSMVELRRADTLDVADRRLFDGEVTSPTVDASGTVAVVVETVNGNSRLSAAGLGPNSSDASVIHDPRAAITDAAISPTGEHLAWVEGGSLYVADWPELASVTGIATNQVGDVAWSHDGKRLAFAQTSGGQSTLYTSTIDQPEPRPVVSPPTGSSDRSPNWHPTCEVLVFLRSDSSTADISFVNLDDLAVSIFRQAGAQSSPSFAAVGPTSPATD